MSERRSPEQIVRKLRQADARSWIGDATWKNIDRAAVEVLVGAKV